jgi:hypothetical protein
VHQKLGKTPYEAFFSQEISFKEISAYKFGCVIAYSNVVTSSTVYESRVNFGSVVGRSIAGNLLVENFATKVIENVALVSEIIDVDDTTRLYFENYDLTHGVKYRKRNTAVVSTVSVNSYGKNPINPVGPRSVRSIEEFNYRTLEPRRLDVCCRSEVEDAHMMSKKVHNYHTEVQLNPDPKDIEVGPLCRDSRSRGVGYDQSSNSSDFADQRMFSPVGDNIDYMVNSAMMMLELDTIYQRDGSVSESDDDEDYNLVPPTRHIEDDSDDGDDEREICFHKLSSM